MNGPNLLFSYTTFCFIMATTPGPNNMMVLASGVRFGTRRTLPLILGIAAGMAVLFGATGSGLGAAFKALPLLALVLRLLSAGFLFWLAWKIATAGPLKQDQSELKILGFPTGVGFQWINPKAWAAAMTAASTYLPADAGAVTIGVGAAIIALAALFATTVWMSFGLLISRFLHDPRRAQAFNIVMAILLPILTMNQLV